MKNKSILGFNLIAKGINDLSMEEFEDATSCYKESNLISDEISNSEMQNKLSVFAIKLAYATNNIDKANNLIEGVLDEDVDIGTKSFYTL